MRLWAVKGNMGLLYLNYSIRLVLLVAMLRLNLFRCLNHKNDNLVCFYNYVVTVCKDDMLTDTDSVIMGSTNSS